MLHLDTDHDCTQINPLLCLGTGTQPKNQKLGQKALLLMTKCENKITGEIICDLAFTAAPRYYLDLRS